MCCPRQLTTCSLPPCRVIPDLKPEVGGVADTQADVEKNAAATIDDVAAAKAEAQAAAAAAQPDVVGASHPEHTPAMLRDLRKSKLFGSVSGALMHG